MTRSQVLASTNPDDDTNSRRYSVLIASDSEEVLAAQRLRYQVFAGELGAKINSLVDGLDADRFDEHCDHLIVRDDATGEIVGTYRMLPPSHATAAGGLYSDTEFDLSALSGIRGSLVETGRSCVHPHHRSGAVVSLVWAGIGRYMMLAGHRYLAGCASVPLDDHGRCAAGVWDLVRVRHYAPETQRVLPWRPWRAEGVARPLRPALPPLLKGYTRLGAKVCGPPAHDPDFGVADFFTLLDFQRVDARYLRFFLGSAA